MKMYFLVEGNSTEKKVYPAWLKILIPSIVHHSDFDCFKTCDSGLYLFSGQGYPSILNHISNSVADINETGDVDYFFVVLDCDESSVEERTREVVEKINETGLSQQTQHHVIVQKRCFETTLLGNKKIIARQPNSDRLLEFKRYYDVISNDPEEMGNYSDRYTHSQFHGAYVKAAFVEKRVTYSKSNPSVVASESFLNELTKRVSSTSHLSTFAEFINKISDIVELHFQEQDRQTMS